MFRKILFLALFSVASISAFAQNVDAFKYQAVLRSGGTQVISSQNVSLRFSIREGGPNGPEVYSEEHNVVTNAIGLVNLNVGNGQNVIGDLRTLEWGTNRYFVRTELDASGGTNYAFLGVSELLAVPYAFKAGDVVQKQDLERTGDSIRVTDNPNATWLDMADLRDNTDDQSLRFQNGLVILSRELTEDTADLNPFVSARLNQFGLDSVLNVNGEAAGQDIQNLGNVGIGTTPGFTLHMVDTVDQISAAPSQSAYFEIAGGNTAGRIRNGVFTEIRGTDGTNIAINGSSPESSAGTNIGVFGGGYNGATGIGVEGWAEGNNNFNIGVEGFARNPTPGSNWGVYGLARRANGTNRGLYGVLQDTTNRNGSSGFHLQDAAVYGNAAGIGWNTGLLGRANNANPDTNVAILGFAENGGQNYALWTEEGDAMFNDTAIFNYGAQNGYVLTSDPNGRATWQAPAVQGLDSVLAVGNDAAGQIIQNLDSLGIGGTPQYTLHIIDTVDNTSANYNYSIFGQISGGTVAGRQRAGMLMEISGTNGVNVAIDANSNGNSAGENSGIVARARNASTSNVGVQGIGAGGQQAIGSYGLADSGSVINLGVLGIARNGASDQAGVRGFIDSAGTSNSGRNWGVNGFVLSESSQPNGNRGVEGAAQGTHSGDNIGVWGIGSGGGNNFGARFLAGASSVGGTNFSIGAEGQAFQTNSGFNYGLQGIAGNSTNGNRGVVGQLRGATNRSGGSGYHLADAAIYGFTISTGWSAAVLGRANGSNPTDTNVALLGFAENGATNYALWTEEGDAMFNDTAIFNYGNPQAGYVLTSDANGRATWQATASDSTQLTDADNDTRVEVEQNADEDLIRFTLRGTEYFRMDTGKLEVFNTGESTFMGAGAGESDDLTTNRNTAFGYNALRDNQTGIFNTMVGWEAGKSLTAGSDNAVFGANSFINATSGNRNTVVGYISLTALTSGSNNTVLGSGSAGNMTTGSNNVLLGSEIATGTTSMSNSVRIGYNAGGANMSSNTLFIENSNSATPLIYGDFSSDSLRVHGSVTADSLYLPNGATSGYVLTSDANGKASWQESAPDTLPIIRDADTSSSIQISNSDVINFVTNSNQRLSLTSNGSFNLTLNDAASNILFRKQLTNFTAGSAYQLAEFRMTNADFKNNSGAYISLSGDDGNSGVVDFGRIQWENLNDGTEDEGLLSFWTSDGTAPQRALTIDQAQRVGIGTATPGSDLEVVGMISTDSLQVTDGAVNGYVLTSDGAGNATWQAASGGDQDSTRITDADNDTRIEVEQTTDDDQISFTLGGTEHFRMDSVRLGVFNSGFSVFIGEDAGLNDDLTTNENVFIGFRAGQFTTSGARNTALGARALRNTVTGINNVAIGRGALEANTAADNVAVGMSSLSRNTSGTRNVAMGISALGASTTHTGDDNVALGAYAMRFSTTGSDNIAIGFQSNGDNRTGNRNVGIGYRANYYNRAGHDNTILGYQAGEGSSSHNKSGNVFIGYQAGRNDTSDNKLYIDNSSTNEPLIYGDFANDSLRVNGTLFVRDGFIADTANAQNGYVLTSDANGKATWQAASTSAPQDIDSVLSVGSDAGNDSIYNLRMLGIGTSSPTATIDVVNSDDNFNLSIVNSKVTGTGEVKGVFSSVTGTGASDKFGLYGEAINGTGINHGVFGEARRTGGVGTTYGIYGTASGAANNYAGYFDQGDVYITNGLAIGTGGLPGYSLDVAGDAYIDVIMSDSTTADTLISNLAFLDSLRIGNAYSFPSVAGTSGQILEYNGSGELVWGSAANSVWDTNATSVFLPVQKNLRIGGNDTALSDIHLGAFGHLQWADLGGDSAMFMSQNIYWDGTGLKYTLDGPNSFLYAGEREIGLLLSSPRPAGTTWNISNDLITQLRLDENGVAINDESAQYALDVHPTGTDSIAIAIKPNGNEAALLTFIDSTFANAVSLGASDSMLTSYKIILPDTAPVDGEVMVYDASSDRMIWSAGGASTCPAGMQSYGGTGCIDEAERTAATWFVADSTCASLGYELADYGAWYGATANAVLTDETDDWEWVRNISQNNMMVVGNGGLTNRTFQDPTTTAPYRCTTRID